jgi:hypothetical protein
MLGYFIGAKENKLPEMALSRNGSADYADFTDYKRISYIQVILIQN